jgi:amino acid permease
VLARECVPAARTKLKAELNWHVNNLCNKNNEKDYLSLVIFMLYFYAICLIFNLIAGSSYGAIYFVDSSITTFFVLLLAGLALLDL